MKRSIPVILATALLLLSGCAKSTEAATGTDTIRISAILPHRDDGYWQYVGDGFLEAAQRLAVDAKIYTPDLNYNVELMTELIRQQIATQVDALIVQGIDDADYIAALSEARDQGICVVLVDTDLPNFEADLYVGTNNYEAGMEMGKRLVEVTHGKANVAILSGAPGYLNLEERIHGIRDATAAYPGIQFLRLEFDQYDAMTVMEKYYLILRENPEIDTLLTVEGTGGQTLGQMTSSGFTHILVFDDSEESVMGLKNGLFDGIICQQNYQMGVICIEELYQWFTTGAFSQKKIYTPVYWLTNDDLEESLYGE